VVRVLHALAERENLPWHRIIRADGFIALPREAGGLLQARLLRAEGVRVSRLPAPKSGAGQPGQASRSGGLRAEFRVDLKKYDIFS
jgi:alkylated DNA nucleotide flippase Atl1